MKKKILFFIVLIISISLIALVYNKTTVGISGVLLKDLDNNDYTKWYVMGIVTLFIAIVSSVIYKVISSLLDR